jgi:hypothetical protein
MDIILDNIFLIILLLVGAISQWLKARGEARQNQDTSYDPADIEEMIEEAERRQSRPAVPPPLPPAARPHPTGGMVTPAPSLRRKSREPEPAAAFDTSSELARQQEIADKLKEMKRTRGARAMSDSLLPRKQAAAIPGATAGLSLKQRLGHRRELRQAFVLKEILEKPVGLR